MQNNDLKLASLVRASENTILAAVQEETVILHTASGIYFGLNRVGGRVWNLIQSEIQVSKIVDTLEHEFEIDDRNQLELEVLSLIGELEKSELVSICAG